MWIEKAAKSKQEKIVMFNQFLKQWNLSEINEFEELGNGYKVMQGNYSIYFSDFDVNMNGVLQIFSGFDRFAKSWGNIIASRLDEDQVKDYIDEFKVAEKPYIKHLEKLDEYSNNF